jgi:hypothetical protein
VDAVASVAGGWCVGTVCKCARDAIHFCNSKDGRGGSMERQEFTQASVKVSNARYSCVLLCCVVWYVVWSVGVLIAGRARKVAGKKSVEIKVHMSKRRCVVA